MILDRAHDPAGSRDGARVHIFQFKNNEDYKLFYSDTVPPGPSIFIDEPLKHGLVDSKQLGLMKLEHVLTKYVGINPCPPSLDEGAAWSKIMPSRLWSAPSNDERMGGLPSLDERPRPNSCTI
uniref:DNA polymerase n=1 Tax=Phellinidium ferrugineofuscum TaxID=167367 RepID=UPI0023AAF4E7|nr:DNA polymerase [Phellinidium ferrugineofuscum]WCF76807.1 DNA polymerase [Phellinidium ferrugineofuscum]